MWNNSSNTDLLSLPFDLERDTLRGRNLDQASLSFCHFGSIDVHGASFCGADLHGADLGAVRGLTPEQLAGADLGAAILPTSLSFPALDAALQLSARAEKTLYLLLATCTTVFLFLSTIDTRQLFLHNSNVTIPSLELPLSVQAFFVVTPLLIMVLYTSLILTLGKFAVTLRDLPARFPNNRTIDQNFSVSHPNFAALACARWKHLRRRKHETTQERIAAVLLAWLAAPVTILVLWSFYLQTHRSLVISWHVFVLTLTTLIGVHHYRVLDRLLRGRRVRANVERSPDLARFYAIQRTPPPPDPVHRPQRRWRRSIRRWRRSIRRWVLKTSYRAPLIVAVSLSAISVLATRVTISAPSLPLISCRPGTPTRCWGLADASLKHASLSHMVARGANLRRAKMAAAELDGASLEGADLQGADLVSADLRSANLADASLDEAVLRGANLDSARLREASLKHADLRGASLRAAELQGVDLARANLLGAELEGAVVCGARFDAHTLSDDQLSQVHGLQFAATPRGLKAQGPPAFESPQDYLRGNAWREHVRWKGAWQQLYTRLSLVAGGRAQRSALTEALYQVDLSMSETTQQMKDGLLEEIARRSPNGRGEILLTARIVNDYDALRDRVRTMARNRCVDVDDPFAPVTRPAAPPGFAGS